MVHSRPQDTASCGQQNAQEVAGKLCRQGREDPATMNLFREMREKRREWARAIEKGKSSYWKDFLDKASSENFLWKAAKYTAPRDNHANIPPLVVGQTEYTDNKDKARALMENFFPTMNEPTQETSSQGKDEIPWEPISEEETERALKAAKGKTALGEDGLPMLVWKNTWRHSAKVIFHIFSASVNLGYYPRRLKIATIVVLRKSENARLLRVSPNLPPQHARKTAGGCNGKTTRILRRNT
jgi:hypothetical protein